MCWIAIAFLLAIGANSTMANQYPSTGLTEYHYTNTWMSGSDTNRLIFYSVRSLESGMRTFEVIVKNQTDETYIQVWHYGAGWVGAGAEGWAQDIDINNFVYFYNGQLRPLNQQVFIAGSSLTQANQVAIVPFDMKADNGNSRTGYVLGPQVPEPAVLFVLALVLASLRRNYSRLRFYQ